MLSSIHIENIALIKNLDIDFTRGFSAFTGETGAGKSIVIDAIGMVCGAKVSKEIIRKGEETAKVEAVFCDFSAECEKKLCELGISPDEDGILFVARALGSDGKSSVKINGRTVPLSLLREGAAYFANIHGQHDNAELLRPEKHTGILDSFSDNEELLCAYRANLAEYNRIKKEIEALSFDEKEKKRQTDILSFQIKEIKSANLKRGEEEKLLAKKNKLRYAEKINNNSRLTCALLYESDKGASAVDSVERALTALGSLCDVVDEAQSLRDRLENVKYELIDISETVADFTDGIDEDPTRALDVIESRLDVISRLSAKYGESVDDILSFCEECERKLSDVESSEDRLIELEKALENAKKALGNSANALTDARVRGGESLCQRVEQELKYLDMNGASFKVSITPAGGFTATGADEIEFLIRTNSGEGFNSLARTASGGELARVMLAIKNVLSEKDGVDTLVFDEIDTGISGKTSRKIGIKLMSLSEGKQVFCVTHSAQIASLAKNHYKISKSSDGERTSTSVTLLDGDTRVREVARIISGIDLTEASLETARELIENVTE